MTQKNKKYFNEDYFQTSMETLKHFYRKSNKTNKSVLTNHYPKGDPTRLKANKKDEKSFKICIKSTKKFKRQIIQTVFNMKNKKPDEKSRCVNTKDKTPVQSFLNPDNASPERWRSYSSPRGHHFQHTLPSCNQNRHMFWLDATSSSTRERRNTDACTILWPLAHPVPCFGLKSEEWNIKHYR